MTGSTEAERHRRDSTIHSRVRVVVYADDSTSAATESELRKIRSEICELYGDEVRGVLGSGTRDVPSFSAECPVIVRGAKN